MAATGDRTSLIRSAVVIAMAGLALLGVALTAVNSAWALLYWVVLVPVYGALSIAAAWVQDQGQPRWGMILRQLAHWGGVTAALALAFWLGEPAGGARGMLALTELLLLALGSYLAGVYFDRRFILIGLLLALTALVLAKIDQYAWLVFLAGIAIALVFAAVHWRGWAGGRR